jgi:hypothetical protein
MFQIAEVVETKTAFKPGQKDEKGHTLPLGSIQVRIGGGSSLVGQVRNIYARPAIFNRRIPLIGEQVVIMSAPVHDHSARPIKNNHMLYFSPYNATDDLVLHQFTKLWLRSNHVKGGSGGGSRLADKEKPGYTFPKNPKKTNNIQPFEGDDLMEGRFGQSIRFSSTIEGDTSVYSKKPSWKGGSNGDPIMVIRIKKPTTPGNYRYDFEKNTNPKTNQYSIEDIAKDESSIYLTSTQKIPDFKAGFTKNKDAVQISSWSSGAQIVVSSDRLVLNAKKDKIFIIGKSKAIVTSEKVLFQSKKYKVDLDDLMDYINAMCKEMWNWASGQKQFSTSMGPTLVATNMGEVTKLHKVEFNKKFKLP